MEAILSPASSSQSTAIESVLRNLQSVGIMIPDADEVRNYLLDHPSLVDPASKIGLHAVSQFTTATELALEVYHDIEIDDTHLALYVRQQVYPDDFMTTLDSLWQPWEDQLSAASGFFVVTTDFRPPRWQNGV